MGLSLARGSDAAQRQVNLVAYELLVLNSKCTKPVRWVSDVVRGVLVPADWGDVVDDFLTVTDEPESRLPPDLPYTGSLLREAVEWESLVDAHDGRCLYCGRARVLTIDHIRSRHRGGTHDRQNLAPACKSCNSSKGAKPLADWLQRRPDLSLGAIRSRWRSAGRGAFPA
jgi:5-methylcytosine-specific restriction endonuclease McrA